MRDCLSEDELYSIARSGIFAGVRPAIDEHVARCDTCARLLAELARERVGDNDEPDADLEAILEAPALGVDSRVDRFVIRAIAGRGGMGRVYCAWDPELACNIALKVLPRGHAADVAERFSREARILSELKHPGIVDYVAHGCTPDGHSYLAMEWLEGKDLAALLAGGVQFTVEQTVSILAQAAHAVASAHRRGIVHRDLKPSNLFLIGGRPDRVKVVDFGIAWTVKASTLTRTGYLVGTPNYMAPEQARGARDITPAADVFALGCVMYECLSGRAPFAADHVSAVLTRILFDDPEPLVQKLPALDRRLSELVEWMLAKNVATRPPNAGAVHAALVRLSGAEPDAANTTALAPRSATVIGVGRGLHGVVLAAAATPPPGDLGAVLTAARARWEWLVDETLVASVRGHDSALDLADEAARIALLVKQRWPAATVVLSIGVDASQQAPNLHRAVRGRSCAGVWLDELASKLLARRFELATDQREPVLKPGAARVDEDRPLLGRPTACVGREQELGAIEAALAGCVDDAEARAVLILAGPGLGKSRLRHELLRRVSTRSPAPLVLDSTGELASAGAPYGMLRQAVRRWCAIEPGTPLEVARARLTAACGGATHTACFVGELAGVPFPEDHHPALATARANPQVMQEQIHRAFLAFITAAACERPVLLILDDLHWGDALGIALVDELLREASATPVLVLALARPELRELFPRMWQGRRVQELALPALSRRASERLLSQVLPAPLPAEKIARFVELSGGNALFLEELARSAAEDPDAPVPRTVIAMIEARVGRLPVDSRQTLFLASVLGRGFARADLRALAYAVFGASDDVDAHLERLASAELITRAGAHDFTFRHAFVRDATYELLAEDERRKIHTSAAEVLAHGPDRDPLVLAEHWQCSSTPARAIPWLLEAAQTGWTRWDLHTAMRLVQRALAFGPTGMLRGKLRAVEAVCLAYTGQMPIPALDEALELLASDDTYWCMAAHMRLTLSHMTGTWQTTQPLAERFLAAEPNDESVAEYVSGLGTLSTIFVHSGLPAPAQRFRDRLELVAARRPELVLIQAWRSWTDACLLDVHGGPASDVLRMTERSAELYRSAANHRNSFFCDGQAALLLADAGDEAGAIARLQRTIGQTAQMNEHYVHAWLSCILAQLLASGPAYADALAITDTIVSEGKAPPCPDLALGVRARALLTAGRVAEAEELARQALERVSWAPGFTAIAAAALVEALARQGRRDEAIAAGEHWLAHAPPNTSARAKRDALTRALTLARAASSEANASR